MKVTRAKGGGKKELKEKILRKLPRLLERDEVFRSQFITIFKTYFAEKEKTEDRFNILLEELKELKREGEERWQEALKRLDEQGKRIDEHSKILEEHSKILQEHSKRLEEHSKILEEHSKRLEELTQELKILTRQLIMLRERQDVQIGALGARWGLKSEKTFRNAVKGLLEEYTSFKVERYEEVDTEGEVFDGRPGYIVELDLLIRDEEVIIGEIKSSVSLGDVLLFEKKIRFYEKKKGKRVDKKVIISPMVEPKALEFCKNLGIIVYTDLPLYEGEEES